jgi:hypothetical protein
MANYKAVANGNWSALATWEDDSTGSFIASTVLPGVNDDVWANNFTVTIDQSINVKSLSAANRTATGITFDGVFLITATGITVQAVTIWIGQRNYAYSFQINITLGSVDIVCTTLSALNGSAGGTGNGFQILGSNSTVNLTADLIQNQAGSFTNTMLPIRVLLTNTLNITATTILSQAASRLISNLGTVNITGNCYGSNINSNGHVISDGGTNTIIGGMFGGLGAVVNGGTVTASGQISNSDGNMALRATASLRLYSANQTEWTFQTDNLLVNTTLYTPGVAIGFPATTNVKTGVTYGPTSNLTGTCAVPPAAAVSLGVPVDNTVGTASLDANALAIALDAALTASLTPALTTSLNASLSASLPTPISASLQASLPTPIATALNTSLSASLPAAIAPLLWDEDVANLTTPNSIGERLKNCSTVATTGAQIASFNP